jgi:hypothetical protein
MHQDRRLGAFSCGAGRDHCPRLPRPGGPCRRRRRPRAAADDPLGAVSAESDGRTSPHGTERARCPAPTNCATRHARSRFAKRRLDTGPPRRRRCGSDARPRARSLLGRGGSHVRPSSTDGLGATTDRLRQRVLGRKPLAAGRRGGRRCRDETLSCECSCGGLLWLGARGRRGFSRHSVRLAGSLARRLRREDAATRADRLHLIRSWTRISPSGAALEGWPVRGDYGGNQRLSQGRRRGRRACPPPQPWKRSRVTGTRCTTLCAARKESMTRSRPSVTAKRGGRVEASHRIRPGGVHWFGLALLARTPAESPQATDAPSRVR